VIHTVVLDFQFSSPLRNGGAKSIAVRPKMGQMLFLPFIHFSFSVLGEVAKFLLPPELRHVVKFRKCQLIDVKNLGTGKIKIN